LRTALGLLGTQTRARRDTRAGGSDPWEAA
jgi:hypothetical protein